MARYLSYLDHESILLQLTNTIMKSYKSCSLTLSPARRVLIYYCCIGT